MKYKNKHLEIIEKKYGSKFDDYRRRDIEKMEKNMKKKLGGLHFHHLLRQIPLPDLLLDFDATSLYHSAKWDLKSLYPRRETGFAFMKDMDNELAKKYNSGIFIQKSALLKIKFYNVKNLIIQLLPVEEKMNKHEVNQMRKSYNVDVLTSVDNE